MNSTQGGQKMGVRHRHTQGFSWFTLKCRSVVCGTILGEGDDCDLEYDRLFHLINACDIELGS